MIEIDRIRDCDTQVPWSLTGPCLELKEWSSDSSLCKVWHKLLLLVLASRLVQCREKRRRRHLVGIEVNEEAAVVAARKGVGGCGKQEERGGVKMYSQRERTRKADTHHHTHAYIHASCVCVLQP